MTISSALNVGVQGFNKASLGVEQSAVDINRAAAEQRNRDNTQIDEQRQLQAARPEEATSQPAKAPARIDDAIVNLQVEKFNAQANARTIQTADEVLGTLIDVRV